VPKSCPPTDSIPTSDILCSDVVHEMRGMLRFKLRRSDQAVVRPIYTLEISGSNTVQGISYSHRAP